MKVKSNVKSGAGNLCNRCESVKRGLKVKSGVKAGGLQINNRCEALVTAAS